MSPGLGRADRDDHMDADGSVIVRSDRIRILAVGKRVGCLRCHSGLVSLGIQQSRCGAPANSTLVDIIHAAPDRRGGGQPAFAGATAEKPGVTISPQLPKGLRRAPATD